VQQTPIGRIESLTEEQTKEAVKDIASHHYDMVAIAVTVKSKKSGGKLK